MLANSYLLLIQENAFLCILRANKNGAIWKVAQALCEANKRNCTAIKSQVYARTSSCYQQRPEFLSEQIGTPDISPTQLAFQK